MHFIRHNSSMWDYFLHWIHITGHLRQHFEIVLVWKEKLSCADQMNKINNKFISVVFHTKFWSSIHPEWSLVSSTTIFTIGRKISSAYTNLRLCYTKYCTRPSNLVDLGAYFLSHLKNLNWKRFKKCNWMSTFALQNIHLLELLP